MTPKSVKSHPDTLSHRTPCRWEWILKYCRTVLMLTLFVPTVVPAPSKLLRKAINNAVEPVRQSYCWNEYEDLPSRAYAAPVVVRAICTVIYSRGSLAQFNATFSVIEVLKASHSTVRKSLENKRSLQLNFGLIEDWTVFPENADDIQRENLLRGQACTIPRVDLQREYLLFLQPRSRRNEPDSWDNNIGGRDERDFWSIFAAPEVASPVAVRAVSKGLKQAKRPVVSQFRRSVIHIKHGQPVSLQCRVKGFPRPKILWYKDGINLNQRHRKDLLIRRKKKRTSAFRIKRTRYEDAGTYRCVAVNVVGSSQSETVIKVMADISENTTDNSTTSTTHWVYQGIPCSDRGFCLNGGTCRYYAKLAMRSCSCLFGWDGHRCEERHITEEVVDPATAQAFFGGFQIFSFITNSIIIILLLAVLYWAFRIHRVLTSAACTTSARSVGSLYPGLGRQYSVDSRTQEQLNVRLDCQVTGRHIANHSTTIQQMDERESLLTVNHQTTVDSTMGPNLKSYRVESHNPRKPSKPGQTPAISNSPVSGKGPWKFSAPKWPAASTTLALATKPGRNAARPSGTATIVPARSAPNLNHIIPQTVNHVPASVPPPYTASEDTVLSPENDCNSVPADDRL